MMHCNIAILAEWNPSGRHIPLVCHPARARLQGFVGINSISVVVHSLSLNKVIMDPMTVCGAGCLVSP